MSTSNFSRRRRVLLIVFVLLCAIVLAFIRFNFSPSMSGTVLLRLYREPRVGDRVLVCLPEDLARVADARGYAERHLSFCPTGVVLYKRLVAVPGDHVLLAGDGAPRINGPPRGSVAAAVDSRGRQLLPFRLDRALQADECVVLGDHVGSWDSRYFGPVPCDLLNPVLLLK